MRFAAAIFYEFDSFRCPECIGNLRDKLCDGCIALAADPLSVLVAVPAPQLAEVRPPTRLDECRGRPAFVASFVEGDDAPPQLIGQIGLVLCARAIL
jgi:hypothetical protein